MRKALPLAVMATLALAAPLASHPHAKPAGTSWASPAPKMVRQPLPKM